ncbi:MAG: hypothetical protein ACK5B9_11530 [Flavobacteriia bacterium]|jgi:hypothetical protein
MSEKRFTVNDFVKAIVVIKFKGDYEKLFRILDVGNIIHPSLLVKRELDLKGKYLYCLPNVHNNIHLHWTDDLDDMLAPICVSENDIFTLIDISPLEVQLKPNEPLRHTPNVLLQDMQETFSKCLEVATRKNSDYGGKDSNPFQNFSNSEIVGVSIPKGIMVRMMDKVSRISTLLEKEAQVKDEAIEDTLDDLINYTAILKSYLKRNKDGK